MAARAWNEGHAPVNIVATISDVPGARAELGRTSGSDMTLFRVRYASKQSIKKHFVGHTLESMISVAELHVPHVVF